MRNNYNSLGFSVNTEPKRTWRKMSALLLFFVMFSVLSVRGQVTVAGAVTGNGSYTTLSAAFAAIPATQTAANITVTITDNTSEPAGGATLVAGTWTSLTIAPSGGSWIISGAATAGNPLINFNGSDNVTINGGGNLTISNTTASSTAGTSTLKLIGDATNNTFNNVTFLGSSITAVGSNGGTVFISTAATSGTGNDNNSFQSCKFGAAGTNLPSKAIFGNGTGTNANIANSNITINNCEIYDFFLAAGCAGVYTGSGNTNWNVTNNKIYQTASRSMTSSMYGVYFSSTSYGDNVQITGNTIGYSSNAGTGTFTLLGTGSFYGIYFSGQSAGTNANNLNNNTVSDISLTSTSGTLYGIYNVSGASANTVNINSNTIKNIATVNCTGTIYGIHWTSATNLSASNNNIYNITRSGAGTTYGMYSLSSSVNETVSGNTIHDIVSTSASLGTIWGIYQNTTTGTKLFQNNSIYNFSGNAGMSLGGMYVTAGTTVDISGNTIYGFTNTGGTAGQCVGIWRGGTATTQNIYNNKIYGLSSTSTGPLNYGLYVAGGTTTNIYNNLVGGLTTPAATNQGVSGLFITGGTTVNAYYNTVYLSGTSSGSGFGSFAVYVNTATTVDLRNNIFVNATTATGSGLAVAYRRSSSTLTSYASTSNNNMFYGSTMYNDGVTSYPTLAAYQTLVASRDSVSKFQNVTFASTTGSDANFLNFTAGAINFAGGTAQVLASPFDVDFSGAARSGTAPDMGGFEFAEGLPSVPSITSFTPSDLCVTGGQTVTITGTDLGLVTSVGFNGAGGVNSLLGTIVSQSDTTIVVTTPANVVDGVITATNYVGSANSAATFIAKPTPTITVTSDVAICAGGAGTSLVAAGGATYSWSPALGLSATTGDTVTANPTSTTTYTVIGTSAFGCANTAQVTVTVNPTPSAVSASKSPSNVCANGITTLATTGGTIGSTGTIAAGAGASTTSGSGGSGGNNASPFSHYYGGYKAQYVYRASELTALGLTAGNVTSLAFDVTTAGTTYAGFTLSLGHTSATVATSTFDTATLTQVYTGNYNVSATGLTNITFGTGAGSSSTFVWDGVSNIVVNLCWSNNNGGGTAAEVKYDTTSFVAMAYYRTDSSLPSAVCSATSGTTLSTRPKVVFGYANSVPTVFSWSPATDLYTDAAATTAYAGENLSTVYSKGTDSVTYTVSSTSGSCSATNTVTVSPNALPTITITPSSASICDGGAGATVTASGAVNYQWSPALGLDVTNTASVVATPSATTTFTVTGYDANDCSNTATVDITVNTPVAITVQPDNQVVLENASATFTVAATGTGLSYQWKENGVDISGANSATYVLTTATSAENGYTYTCEVSGASPCTPVLSAAATLTVGSVSITAQPIDQTICSNGTATFTLGTSGDVTDYQWQYSSDGTSWFNVSGEVSASLVLSGLTSANSNTFFRCLLNSGAVPSNAATLLVYDIVAITTQPTNATVCVGAASVSFTTAATGSGVAYQWQFSADGGTSWANVASGGTSATYTVTAPTAALDAYQYKANVTGTSPCTPLTSDVATLRVIDVTVEASTASVCIGSPVTLTATFTGNPAAPTSSWICATVGSGAETEVSGNPAVITPTAVGTYTYTYTSTGTCSSTKTVAVSVSSLPVISAVTATPASVCSDATINLAAESIASANGTAALGAGASTGTSTGQTIFPGAWGGAKSQYLIKASELTALGFGAGNLTSIGFEPTTSGQTYQGFSVSIATTAATALTSTFIAPGTQVYAGTLADTGFTPVASVVNTLAFGTGSGSASSFAWDGTSNVVLTFCWTRVPSASTSTNSGMKYDAAGFTSTTYKQADSQAPAAMLAQTSGSTSTNRPRFTFGGVLATNLASTYTWSWNSTPAVTTALGTTSVSNTSGTVASQTFTATATNGVGCTNSLTTSAVQINTTLPAPTGTDSAQCGSQTPACSVTGTGGAFKWYLASTGGTALAGQAAATLSSYPVATTTTFYVSEVTADGLCESPRTAVTVTVSAPPVITLSAATATNCSGSASLTPVTIDSNPGGYTIFNWTDSATVSGDSTSGWSFSPTATTTYVLTASDGTCSATASVTVTPTALPSLITAVVPSSICVGASSTLTAQTGSAGTATIGAGATTSATYSNPFYSAWSNTHTQHIVLASELTAMGLTAGNITSVALDVTSAGTLPMIDLSVKIGNTAATSMAAFVSNAGFQTVYNNPSLLPTVGVNTLTFSTPYNWDGTSNLVLEFCHGNGSSTSTMSRTVKADATAYVSSIKAQVSGATSSATICGDTTTNLLTYSVRPKFIFGGKVSQGVGALAYTWNDPSTTTGNVLTVSPTATTSYTVSGYDSTTGCTGTATATVTVYTPPTAPTVTSANQCGPRVPLVSVADTNGYTTPTYKWYADNVTNTALQASTSTTYTTSVSTTTTFYVSVLSPGGCESPRTAVTTTVLVPAPLTISPAVTICSGSSTTLTVSGSNTYVWSPATDLDTATGDTVMANPTVNTTYTVTGTDANGCTSTASVVVAIQATLTPITAGSSFATVCLDSKVDLTATSFDSQNTQTEGFESLPTIPAGWTFLNAGSGNAWGYSTGDPYSGSNALAYQYNLSNAANAWAITPAQNLLAGKTYTISYWYNTTAFGGSYPENLKLTVGSSATAAGQTTTLLDQPGLVNEEYAQAIATFTPSTSGTYYFGLNCYSDANQNLLTVDDFTISSPSPATYSWTSVPAGFTSSDQNPTDVTVNADTTYSVTATNGACSSTSEVSVTTTPLSDFTLTDVTICNGSSANLVILEGGMDYTWSPATGLNTTTGDNVTANPSVTTTYTVTGVDTTSGCPKVKTVTVTVSQPGALVLGSSTTSRTIVPGQVAEFTVATVAGPVYAYSWQVSTDGGSSWTTLTNDYVDPTGTYDGATTETLLVYNADETFDQYQYQCIVTGDSPCSSLTPIVATLTVSNTGFATPPASVTLCNSTTANFAIVTSGDEPYGIQWQMSTDNGVTFLDIVDGTDVGSGLTFSGTDTISLDVSDITIANNNTKFLCVLNYVLPSNSATLTVKNPVAITAQPANQTVCVAGGTANFSTTATGDDLTYQWQFSTNGGTSWANYVGTGATTSAIAILNPAVGTDGTLYRVVVSGNAACSSETSTSAILNINNPTITSQPTAKSLVRGVATTYTVAASAATGYQWQYSTNGTTGWADVANATPTDVAYTGATTATLTVATLDTTPTGTANFYRCVVTNDDCTINSNAAQLTIVGYCDPAPSSVDNSGITNVSFGSISNSTGTETNNYGNYSYLSSTHVQASTVNFSITYETGYTYGTKIWIDFNDNGVFTDSGEQVYVGLSTNANPTTLSGSFTLDANAPLGAHRLRIGGADADAGPSSPCYTGSYATFEDYTINITTAPACSGTPIAGTASAAVSSLCSGATGTTLTLTGSTTEVTGISFQWYSSADNVNFAPVSGETTSTLATGSLTADTYYYAAVTCANGESTVNSNTVTITVNDPQITDTTPAAICGTGTVDLGATANAGSTINWYAALTGGTALGTGASFTTPSISATTTYYAEAVSGGGSGNASTAYTGTSTNGTSIGSHGIAITTTVPGIKIVSADIPFTGTGTLTVSLKDASNTTIISSVTTGTVTGAGTTSVTVPLNITVPAADNYLLMITAVTGTVGNLGYSEVTYPATALSGTFSVTSGYWYSADPSSMYLFNLSVSNGCSSTRTAVTATVDPLPTATISYAGSPYCYNEAPVSVTLNGTNDYTGGTFTASPAGLSIDGTTGTIDPSLSTAGDYTITYTTNATAYCTPQTATATVTVNPSVLNAGFTYANTTYCTNSENASPIVTGFAGTFTASPAGLSIDDVTGAINFAASTPGSYTVSNTVSACSSSDVVTFDITVNQAPVIGTQPASALVCSGANASFTVAASGTGVTYQWQENSGSGWATIVDGGVYSDATTASLSITGATVDMNAYQYQVIVSDTSGCGTITSSAAILTVSQPAAPIISPVDPAVCPGGIQALSVTNGLQGDATIGTGTLSAGTTSWPNPFSAWWGGTKHQMLYTAAELQAQGLSAGSVISSIKFDVAAFVANKACTDFTIRMGTTANTALTAFVAGTSTVYGPATYTPSATGLVTFTLSTGFTWDGTSNLIVETVHNAGNSGNGAGTTVKYTTTTGTNTVYYGYKDNVTGGIAGFDAAALTTGASPNRPNTVFGYNLGTTTWSPTTDLYTNAGATIAYTGGNATTVYTKPTSDTTYTAINTNLNGCSNTATTTVIVLPTPTMTGISQPATTCSGSNTTFNVTGLMASSTSTLSYNINGGGTQTVTGVVADGSGNGSFALSLAAFTNGQTLTVTSISRTDNAPSCAATLSSGNTVVISVQPLVTYFFDNDGDGYGDNAISTTVCTGQPVGYVANGTDCDDMNNAVYQSNMLYTDVDGDGYTVGAATTVCYGATLPAGTSLTSLGTDCDDNNVAVYQSNMLYTDVDGDGYTVGTATAVCYGATLPAGTSLTSAGEDCNDNDNTLNTAYTFYIDADEDGYGSKNAASVCAVDAVTPPTGYSLNNSDCNDADPLTWQEATLYIDVDGDGFDAGQGSICYGATIPAGYSETTSGTDCNDNAYSLTNDCPTESVVNVTMFIEGYYTGSSTMASVKNNQDYVSATTEVEDLTVDLYDATTYALVASTTATLNTDGTMSAVFVTAPIGSFYIAVKGSNLLQTWSADPQTVGAMPLSYDFTSASTQAYGDNMVEVETGVWAFFSGDLNQDEVIDGSDSTDLINDIENANFGVLATDLNGDGVVDGSDSTYLINNTEIAVFSYHP